MATEDVRYAFIVEWFDPQASLLKKYNLFFWPATNSIEMYDIKNRRTFLKRVEYPSVKLDSLFIGACVCVYSRQIKVVGFADPFTAGQLRQRLARTACLIKPSAQASLGPVIDSLIQNGFSLSRLLTVRLTDSLIKSIQPEGEQEAVTDPLVNGIGTALELVAPDAVATLKSLCDKTPVLRMSLIAAESPANYTQFMKTFFERGLPPTAVMSDCTMAVIKPHAVRDGLAGKIISAIAERGFEITAAELFYLDRPAAEEFLEVYKTVIPQYSSLVENFTSGASIAIQIHGGPDVVERFREVTGPHDPEIAKHVRPNTLRAVFGTDRINNGLHATDIHEDGTLESEFFFKILQDAKA